MRKAKLFVIAGLFALGATPLLATPASAVVCHDNPGGCCGGVTVLGKEILRVDC